jgi:hypothetical protein
MFVRKNKNRSGSISVQLISKEHGRYRVVKTLGSSHDPDEIDRLWLLGQNLVHKTDPSQSELFALNTQADHIVQNLVSTLGNANVHTIGPELIFGTLFERMGFNQIPDPLFRHLVISRLAYPGSKLKTVDYLFRYQGTSLSVSALYKALDRLCSRYKAPAEAIVYRHTCERVTTIAAIFYDVTTLYFEAEAEDDLRKIGFSKDGKFEHPQIMLGLLVGEGGFPIGYDVFEGNKFEGHTLLPVLARYGKLYGFARPVVVADAAMLSASNLKELTEEHYEFVLGARLKNESEAVKREIIRKTSGMGSGDKVIIEREDGFRLIVSYSERRAHHDRKNREKGLARLKKQVKSGYLTKQNLNKRGYNKFLVLDGDMRVFIDEKKIAADQRWDGLKGYLTNAQLEADKVIEHYSHLWRIEKAFRISKTDLRVRPIYHYRKKRIEAHLCIAFVAYAIYKELEHLLGQAGMDMSAARAAELTHTMYELEYCLPDSKAVRKQILAMTDEQKMLYQTVVDNS